ncbi:MAG: branched-chain amino acid ABC transporter permease [Chloroflexi bacterium]|nr:branched-chain amino acid ABC transporter permease [Chloroflexota bacterium]
MALDWTTALSFLIDGLMLGFVFGVAAMGLTLIWGVMDVINLAHGPLIALAMFGVYLIMNFLGLSNPYPALLLTTLLALPVGMGIYYLAVHRVIDAPHLSSLLATYSVNMMLMGVMNAVFGGAPRNIDFSLGSITLFGDIVVPTARLVAALAAVLIAAALYFFLYRTRVGRYIRAVTDNRDAAELVGVPSTTILALSFGLGVLLAAFAGGLIATIFPFTIFDGGRYELKSFVIGVLGGLGNPIGSLFGGLILGVIEGLVPMFLETSWTPVIEFGLFVFILLVRPTGLFGGKS